MNITKLLKTCLASLIISIVLTSCSDEAPYLEFTDKTSIDYSGAAVPIAYFKGVKKTKLLLKLTNDPSIDRILIEWLENGADKDIEIAVKPEDIGEIKEVLIEDIAQGSYNFIITTYDDAEKIHSVSKEILIEVLGDDFPSLLSPLFGTGEIKGGTLEIAWPFVDAEASTIQGKRVIYTNINDEETVLDIPLNELLTQITDYKVGSAIKFQTRYFERDWIEPLYTNKIDLPL